VGKVVYLSREHEGHLSRPTYLCNWCKKVGSAKPSRPLTGLPVPLVARAGRIGDTLPTGARKSTPSSVNL
jgi:hypothetical protein